MGELDKLRAAVVKFRDAREWKIYHTPKNLAQALIEEVGELNSLYLWNREPDPDKVKEEMADVLIYLLSMSDVCNVDLFDAVMFKLRVNQAKYPVLIYKGICDKNHDSP
jgi:NTP pyrophosphatase (non-canonical NTP hydrolase)